VRFGCATVVDRPRRSQSVPGAAHRPDQSL